MASKLGGMTGYRLVKPQQNPSGGGFTDWFIAQFGRPGSTAELGPYQEETELPLWTFTDIWSENQTVPLYLASEGYKLWHQRYPIEEAATEIQLFAAANLYHRPSDSYPTGGQISAGKVMSDARMGEWYRVTSWMGPKWIRLNETPHIEGHSKQYVRRIKLTEAQTAMYKYPGNESLEPLATLQPQEALRFTCRIALNSMSLRTAS